MTIVIMKNEADDILDELVNSDNIHNSIDATNKIHNLNSNNIDSNIIDTSTKNNILVFDIEYSNNKILQMSWILFDINGNVVNKYNSYVKYDFNIYIDPHSFNVHMITNDMLMTGNYFIDIINEFNKDLSTISTLVSHNLKNDIRVLNHNLKNHKLDILDIDSSNYELYCTMTNTKKFCNLYYTRNNKQILKYPKNIELYKKLFGDTNLTLQLHDAMNDVYVTACNYFKYVHNININIANL